MPDVAQLRNEADRLAIIARLIMDPETRQALIDFATARRAMADERETQPAERLKRAA